MLFPGWTAQPIVCLTGYTVPGGLVVIKIFFLKLSLKHLLTVSRVGGTLFLVNMIHYTKMPSRSVSNLYVAKVGDVEVGFIHRPKNTKTDKNFWRAYFGIGEAATFLGHSVSKQGAMANLNWAIVSDGAVVVEK